jgi:hypothetical protein
MVIVLAAAFAVNVEDVTLARAEYNTVFASNVMRRVMP